MIDASPVLSKDAVIFAFGYLNGARAKLSFGGEGASMQITSRARAALDELIAAGYAEAARPENSVSGREFYRGVDRVPHVGALAREIGFNPFLADPEDRFPTFEKIQEAGTPEPEL